MTLVLLLQIAGLVRVAYAAPSPIDVTVTILHFKALEDPEGPFEHSGGEYYGAVNIDNQGFLESRNLGYAEAANNNDIQPFWRFTRTVDRSQGTASVVIQVRDDDTGVPFSVDDVMDLNPTVGIRQLNLTFNLADGTWVDNDTHLVNFGWSKGNGDTKQFGDGGEQAEITYSIGFGNDNLAGDGIPDGVKRFGVFDIDTGSRIADMATLGADPCRKTIAVQVDYMSGAADGHTHKPLPGAISIATNAFNNAPTPAVSPCPYPGFPQQASGVKLILDVQNAVPEVPVMGLNDSPGDTGFTDDRNSGFNPNRRPYFHYMIMVHDQAAGSSSSGLSCRDGKDFIISLGHWTNEVGLATDQAGSIMHELGHCLGLGHGGADTINCKPNYLSVMNYMFQTTGIPSATPGSSFRFDYSRTALPALNESALVEANGLGGDGKDLTTWSPDNGATTKTTATSGAVDWNNNGTTDANPVSVDVNDLDTSSAGCPGTSGKGTPVASPGETLNGYDDWSNLQYRAALSGTAAGAGESHPDVSDLTFDAAEHFRAFWATAHITGATPTAPISATEGAAISSVTLATFTDDDPSSSASNYSATIDWGDGSSSAGTVGGPSGGPFTVQGGHTYGEEGSFPVTVMLRDAGGASVPAKTTATVGDAALTASGTSIVTLNPFSGTVASFSDADPGGAASDYTATIDWGDGSTSAGSIGTNGSAFTVNGGHSYDVLGPYTIQVQIKDAGGSTASATTTIILFAFPSKGDFAIGDGNAGSGTPATFWGAQWSSSNTVSGGAAPDSFKGFEDSLSPPTCGSTWQTSGGNSAKPPSDLPSYMGVAVADSVSQSGSTIAGHVVSIVVVKTDPGYDTNPGHPGTGTVIAEYCHQ
jgi:hypothetical protein